MNDEKDLEWEKLKEQVNRLVNSTINFITDTKESPPPIVIIVHKGEQVEVIDMDKLMSRLPIASNRMVDMVISKFCKLKQPSAILTIDSGAVLGLEFNGGMEENELKDLIKDVASKFDLKDLPLNKSVLITAMEKHGKTYQRLLIYTENEKGEIEFNDTPFTDQDAILGPFRRFKPWADEQ